MELVYNKKIKCLIGVFILCCCNTFNFYAQRPPRPKAVFSKKIVYSGCDLNISCKEYFNLGFSHIDASLVKDKSTPNSEKFILWTGIATVDTKSNWASKRLSYDNGITGYNRLWNSWLIHYKEFWRNQTRKTKFGIIMLDIEAKKTESDLSKIPPIKESYIKSAYIAIDDYKNEMFHLYNQPLSFSRKNHNNYYLWSSYGDVSIKRNWWGIPKHSWIKWTHCSDNLNYITNTPSLNGVTHKEFYNNFDFLSVNSYYFYSAEKDNPDLANQYLAYMRFQIEANMVWSDKPIYIYHNLKYHDSKVREDFIIEDMVRNSTIFTYTSGVEGIILWERDKKNIKNNLPYLSLFQTFTGTIKLLSKYNDYFRGIDKNGKLLLTATNPFIKQNQTTSLSVYYEGKSINVFKGSET